jgi:UDP-GlcNAc3NAcA epimerase
MISLERSAKMIFTDSGGVQKEAYFYGVPCITMREETEWIETVTMGYNKVVGANQNHILQAYKYFLSSPPENGNEKPYGDGKAANKVVNHILNKG